MIAVEMWKDLLDGWPAKQHPKYRGFSGYPGGASCVPIQFDKAYLLNF